MYSEAVSLLKQLIATPSFSREEKDTADVIERFLTQKNIKAYRKGNNIWAKNAYYTEGG